MHPATGGRFSLRLSEHDESLARYELTLSTPCGEWSSQARVQVADGRVDFDAWKGDGEPPPWLVHYTRAALRSAWRAAAEQGWPRRLTRWRDAPSRGEAPASDD
jgi:hypothetical protein